MNEETNVFNFLDVLVHDEGENISESNCVVVVQQRVDRLLAFHQALLFLKATKNITYLVTYA